MAGRPFKFSCEEARKAFSPGMSVMEFAEALGGCNYRTARNTADRCGLKLSRKPYPAREEFRKAWLELAEQASSVSELARMRGVSRQAAWQAVKKYDLPVPMRTRKKRQLKEEDVL